MEAREGASAEETASRWRRGRARAPATVGGEDVAVEAENGGEPAGAAEQTRRTSRRSRSASGVGGAKIRQGFARVVRSRRGAGE